MTRNPLPIARPTLRRPFPVFRLPVISPTGLPPPIPAAELKCAARDERAPNRRDRGGAGENAAPGPAIPDPAVPPVDDSCLAEGRLRMSLEYVDDGLSRQLSGTPSEEMHAVGREGNRVHEPPSICTATAENPLAETSGSGYLEQLTVADGGPDDMTPLGPSRSAGNPLHGITVCPATSRDVPKTTQS